MCIKTLKVVVLTEKQSLLTFESQARAAKRKSIPREGVWWTGAKKLSRLVASPLDFARYAERACAPTWAFLQAKINILKEANVIK